MMKKLKQLLQAELPALVAASGLGLIFGTGLGFYKGALLFGCVFFILQPFVLMPLFRK